MGVRASPSLWERLEAAWSIISHTRGKRPYHLGEGSLKSSTLLKKISAARHDEVPGQIKRWNRGGGKVLKGLERRREAEAALYALRWS